MSAGITMTRTEAEARRNASESIDSIGFTGTQEGMRSHQINTLHGLLGGLKLTTRFNAAHGCCIGADAQFHLMLRSRETTKWMPYIIGFPSNITKKTARLDCNFAHPPNDTLERNKDIVNTSKYMICCPREMEEVVRSGTWATIRFARKMNKPGVIIYPDGSLVDL